MVTHLPQALLPVVGSQTQTQASPSPEVVEEGGIFAFPEHPTSPKEVARVSATSLGAQVLKKQTRLVGAAATIRGEAPSLFTGAQTRLAVLQ